MEAKQIDLYEFLVEAELQQYYNSIKNELKISNASHLKYATDEDLKQIGLSRPEIRRLRKFYEKYFPHGYLSKIKRLLQNPTSKKDDGSISSVNVPDNDMTNTTNSPNKIPSNKHIIPSDAICVNKQLGAGEFGIVQQGVWTNGTERIQVAIKCLSRERMQANPMEFLKEAAIMHSIEHENIVRLYGVVLDTDSLMLVTELAHLRSLLECLKDSGLRVNFLTVPTLCEFAQQICNGMMYLENKRLIHRDLAARNILVFSKNKVKISDFGLSRALGVGKDYYKTNFNVNLKLPIAWCAPECISYLRFTNSSDVWAYGVCLWEMFSYGFQPWAALTGSQILDAIDKPNYQRLEQPECCPKEYYSLMLNCWQHDPSARPKFSEIYQMLPDIKPEQLKTIGSNLEPNKDHLLYRHGEIITVLDKVTHAPYWKGILNSGKTGVFNPANTVAYLEGLPSSTNRESFSRVSDRSSKRKLCTEMISSPQNDLKHTGHVGLDGAFFGDIAFLATTYNRLPRQIVTPYKPFEDIEQTPLLLPPTPTSPDSLQTASGYFPEDLSASSSTNPTFINSNENTPKHHQTNSFNLSFDFPPSSKCSSTIYSSLNPFRSDTQSSSNNVSNTLKNHSYRLETAFTNSNLDDDDTQIQENAIKNAIGMKWSENEISTITTNTVTTTLSATNEASNHEYHEISDDEITTEKMLDLGPSLLDELSLMFGSITTAGASNAGNSVISACELNSELKSPDFDNLNKKTEIFELTSLKLNRKNNGNDTNTNGKYGKKNKIQSNSGTVKTISVKDEKILNQAIEIANEISARSMTDLVNEHPSVMQSPKRKFSFRFPNLSHHSSIEKEGHHHNSNVNGGGGGGGTLSNIVGNAKERKNFSEELRNIPDLQSSITEEHREAYNSLIEKKTSSSSSSSASVIVGKQLDTNEFKLKPTKNLSRTLTSNSSSTDIVPSTVGNQKLSLSLAASSSFLLFQLNDKFKNNKNNNDDLSVLKQSASRSTTLPSRKINKIKKSNINLESSFLRILRDKNHPIIRTPQKFLSNDECIKGDDGDSENINPQKAITGTSSNNSGSGSSQNEKDTLCESQSYQPNTSYTFPENITKTEEMTINNNITSNKMNDCSNKLTTTIGTENHNNPIPLPPRDRNKIMLTNAKRHVRKHPLIIPAFGVTRTLNKVSEMVPVSEHKRLMFPSKSTNSTIISTFNPIISSESQSQVDKNLNHSSLDKYSARTIKVHESDNSSIKIPKIIQETNNSTMNNPSQSLSPSIASSVSRKNQNQIHIKDNLSNTMNNKYKNVNKNDIVPFYERQYENISNIRRISIDEQNNTDSASLHFELIIENGFDNTDTVPSPEDGLCPFAIQKENYNKQKQHIDIKMSGLYVNEDELRNLDLEKQKLEFLRLRHSKHPKSESEIVNQDDVLARRTDGENVNLEMQQENEQNNPDDKNDSISYNNNNNNNNDNNESNNNETVNEQMLYLQVSDLNVNKNDDDINDDGKNEANNYYDNVNNASGRNMNNTKSVGKYNSVSCEDLLEFSNTKPKGYERGVDSDEVRIILKVLGKDVPPERCLETLEFIEWDVHRAIKIIRLQNISLPAELTLREAFLSLMKYDWDVHTTALKLKNLK